MKSFKILIVDDHATVRIGLKHIITSSFPEMICGETASSAEALKSLRMNRWDMIIVDIKLPGINGLELLHQIHSMRLEIKVLIFSMYTEEQFSIRAIRAGAHGYLTKTADDDQIIQAIRIIQNGRKYITPDIAELLSREVSCNGNGHKPTHEYLSDRELQTFLKIASGKTISAVAEELSLSVSTINTYRSRILKKMNSKTNADLIRYALDNSLV